MEEASLPHVPPCLLPPPLILPMPKTLLLLPLRLFELDYGLGMSFFYTMQCPNSWWGA